ncbi:MAG: Re/Si-specific NAD(P)(+) transhydrogenase subunit alpha [Elusimicrobia bacterium]|nr:Re/Si-specific NAD(P)(+) transhydrogenase subunit alpha [Elusimicrobiota bacterium]
MIVGIPKETAAGEKRVAMVPELVSKLKGLEVHVEKGAGAAAGLTDAEYEKAGAKVAPDARALYAQADLVLKVQPPALAEAALLKKGAALVSFLVPSVSADVLKALGEREASVLSMNLLPRISRAQFMDALSSQATVAGYRAVVIAAESLPKFFPMLITAAGTVSPAKVFVIGAGVAGLQAIAVAHRMGAIVEAYDLRPAVKEQIESLGAKFVSLPVETADAATKGGYAKAQSEEFYQKQRELMAKSVKAADVVITTALVPGKPAPKLIPEKAVHGMRPGSVIVDLAAEQGGNCELTEPGQVVVKHGVTIHGTLNLPSSLPAQASHLYAKNLAAFVGLMVKDGRLNLDVDDELVRGTMVLRGGRTPEPAAVGGAK